MSTVHLTSGDHDLIVAFAGCSLDEKPGSNWVQDVGGLPEYICEIARAIKRSGKSTSQAVAIAVSRVKVWATGKGVDKDTQAKAAKAVAQWEAKKKKSKAKSGRKSDHDLAASMVEFGMSDVDLLKIVASVPKCYTSALDQVLLATYSDD